MKIKHKVGFVALITIIDLFVIILVVINNDQTNIKNDVSNKTLAHIITSDKKEYISETVSSLPNEESKEEIEQDNKEENNEEKEQNDNNTVEENKEIIDTNSISFDDMTLEEKNQALESGTLVLQYSGAYTNKTRSEERLTKSGGVIDYNGHHETYYDEKRLPGTGLNIPGRHVADDGTIRDGEGYICVAANYDYMPKGSILITSLGPAKVYDTGCSYGTIDIYVNW